MNEKRLQKRIKDLMDRWAPDYAKEMFDHGWRLSDGDGLVWVNNNKPHLRFYDEEIKMIWEHNKYGANFPPDSRKQIDVIKNNSDNPQMEFLFYE